jgi:uncharacterized protein involved in exopolysaccharide biosynthesis/Mrp family chromosome partitioning ATPase
MEMKPGDTFSPSRAISIDRPSPIASPQCIDEHTDHDPHFTQLAGILRRRRRLIITIAVLGAMLAGTIGLLIAPKYTATAQIVVEPEQGGPIDSRAAIARPTDQSAIDTHVTMLSSRNHLRRVLDSLSDNSESAAASDKALRVREATGLPSDRLPGSAAADSAVKPIETINTSLSFEELGRRLRIWLAAIASGGPASSRELDELDRGLKIIQERTSRVLSVSITATSPEKAAVVANRFVQLYVSDQTNQKRVQAKQELAALDEHAAELKSELERASEVMRTLLLPQPTAPAGASSEEGKEGGARLPALQLVAASSGQAYAGLLQRQREIRGEQEIVMPEVRILSLASPPDRPSSVNPIVFIFPALIASLIGASLLAIVLERLDQGLRNERDVTDALGLPCIGLVPQLPRSYADQPFHYLLSKPFTPYTEAIRSALATLHFSVPHRTPTTVLISSSVPGEGKTTVAISLSVYAALLGKRVLLVDFDSRRPSVLRTLRGSPETPVPDLPDRPLEEFIQHLTDLNVDYLPMPRGSADPLARFIGKNMQHFLRQAGASYDCVFIDSPPLLGITETRLLAALVDSVIFVVKWGSTRREVVQNAGTVLRSALRPDRGNVVRASALVTQVDLKRHAGYRYGDVGEAFAKYRKYYFVSAKV